MIKRSTFFHNVTRLQMFRKNILPTSSGSKSKSSKLSARNKRQAVRSWKTAVKHGTHDITCQKTEFLKTFMDSTVEKLHSTFGGLQPSYPQHVSAFSLSSFLTFVLLYQYNSIFFYSILPLPFFIPYSISFVFMILIFCKQCNLHAQASPAWRFLVFIPLSECLYVLTVSNKQLLRSHLIFTELLLFMATSLVACRSPCFLHSSDRMLFNDTASTFEDIYRLWEKRNNTNCEEEKTT
jgi:hypothetical protein